MEFLVDGHNLIPKIPGLSLNDPEDEMKLIDILVEYSRLSRRKIILFFDKRAVGHPFETKIGTIRVFHADARSTADETIIRYVQKYAAKRANFTVISSDRHIQVQVKGLGADALASEEFAKQVVGALRNPAKKRSAYPKARLEAPLSEAEISDWLDVFSSGPSEQYSER